MATQMIEDVLKQEWRELEYRLRPTILCRLERREAIPDAIAEFACSSGGLSDHLEECGLLDFSILLKADQSVRDVRFEAFQVGPIRLCIESQLGAFQTKDCGRDHL